MDEYKQYVYARQPETYDNLDAGDLTRQLGIRERLKCKSFHWYMTEIAPDFLVKFPPIEPPSYASGAIQNLAYSQYCLDTMGQGPNEVVGMFSCADNLTHPQATQFWTLSSYRELRQHSDSICLDVQSSPPNATVWMWSCHSMGGNQFWYYDRETQWLVQGKRSNRCMEGFVEDGKALVLVNKCDRNNDRQRWHFGFVNDTLLDKFFEGV